MKFIERPHTYPRNYWLSRPDSKLRTGWMEKAKCKDLDTDIFFPEIRSKPKVKIAKAICSNCHVRRECLDYALGADLDYGIWGGLTWLERINLKRHGYSSS